MGKLATDLSYGDSDLRGQDTGLHPILETFQLG
jgi:hypothetical protein